MFRLRDAWVKLKSHFGRRDSVIAPLGVRGEQLAAAHLESLGMRIVDRGVRYPCGELDLITVDGDVVVFVEVKTRKSGRRGAPSQAVDRKKQGRMTRAALQYLKTRRLLQSRTRFDVVSIVWPDDAGEPAVSHLRAAFDARDSGGMYS
ncbi:MAG: YraN family protein [Planctomycetales bacterium]|nr:YraN family protein [Planctomycetales bacterium]MBN8625882.1 YraN family protein [Planctomycetota bacterium]